MKAFVTGAAGFIGSNLVDRLLQEGWTVVGWDNYSTGYEQFLAEARRHSAFQAIRGDNLDRAALTAAMKGCDTVFHLAANADVRRGLDHPERDLEQNTIATFNVLESMRANEIKRLIFSSTGSVYGEARVIPTPEDAPFPTQTSLYGASKLACEGLIAAYAEGYRFVCSIFRFVSILGERYTHGHVFDFVKQLRERSHLLNILGDGHQRKSYLYIGDCLSAILRVVRGDGENPSKGKVDIYNLGTEEYCSVRNSISWICERLGVTPELQFAGGDRGWIGDNPFIFLQTSRIRALGWKPTLSIRQGVERTVDYLLENPWVFSRN